MDSRPWHASYEAQVKPALVYPDKPLTHWLKEAAAKSPKRPALRFQGVSISYARLLDTSYRFAHALIRLGVRKGDRVALMLPNVPSYVSCYYGCLFAGAVVVQTNPLYKAEELSRQLADSGAETIVCLDLFYTTVRQAARTVPLKSILVAGAADDLPLPLRLLAPLVAKTPRPAVDYTEPEVRPLRRLLRESPGTPIETLVNLDEDPAVLQYTGGTTGTAKGVVLTHRNLVANVVQCRSWLYRAEEGGERTLTAVPLFHVYGMTVCMNVSIAMRGCLLLVPRFDAGSLLKLIQKEKPTLFPGAPAMYIALLHHPARSLYDLSSIRACISGSAPLPHYVQQEFEKVTAGRLVEGYGLSEASPVTHANPIWGKRAMGSIGLPWPDTDAMILDEEGQELPPGEIGELAVKGPQVMKGYWNKPEDTAAVLQDGWLRTGDLGYRDEAGYYYIVDRKKEMINASGLKVYPREIEEVLYRHPDVKEAAVIGVPDDYRGETVKAFLVPKEGAELCEDALDAYCRERLAPYKVPRQYEFRSELPKTLVGKVLRRVLAEEERRKRLP
ncbi:long-chain-fatty-acid--CoA ligase [Paenibacillus sp. J31TS4]|uniref:long-chain-fatty-acid--CoA ligase n=1 Tax=Paenibacillus sp. J31TS4 TaxID=2807195 RepID=UPI001B281E54|nr:long-chain fatty acid--CoA ligase [Paenibacillus sp. J31TS4]GIP37205.1 long-chain-fatty-acid--CoA ligase [Paenibacillus sp. J31TS4]